MSVNPGFQDKLNRIPDPAIVKALAWQASLACHIGIINNQNEMLLTYSFVEHL